MKAQSRGPASGRSFDVSLADVARFRSFIDASGACWHWRGSTNKHGYGMFNISVVRKGPLAAHRVAYVIEHGNIPAGKSVLHLCDNPPCVNPAHLTIGTHAENIADAIAKGRYPWQRDHTCRSGRHAVPKNSGQCKDCLAANRKRAQSAHSRGLREASRSDFDDYFAEHITPLVPETYSDLLRVTDERRANAFARFFGLYGFRPETGAALGDALGISRERVRQIRNDVLRKIGVPKQVIDCLPRGIAWKAESKAA